ncbi:hypothetical protein IM774_06505 [Erysipelotrichaceae bacterium RD49]|nr:hypothetical protein [Erysipelotrichaceae bacterium RD49]
MKTVFLDEFAKIQQFRFQAFQKSNLLCFHLRSQLRIPFKHVSLRASLVFRVRERQQPEWHNPVVDSMQQNKKQDLKNSKADHWRAKYAQRRSCISIRWKRRHLTSFRIVIKQERFGKMTDN